ncbi:MAG TPA: CpsB/CapC family capsule biosynthesis tyrosine phosphatase [Flavobacterium sp.]|nr:CpsB/CapC family capsule biosynthesis tyrosine phosphatase [Flavobacterium sp.]
MFSIFKPKKPFLKDLTVDFVDIHSHVLFGIDDGAKTLEDSAFLMQSFLDLGFKKATTTPHTYPGVWDNSYKDITSKYQEVSQLLPELAHQLDLKVASEYLMDDQFVQCFQSEKLLTIRDNYVLVEMSYINAPIQLYEIIFDLQVAGYKPVLAHPERYIFYHHNLDEYKKLKNSGCLFQINLLSTMGFYGENITKAADQLLGAGLIDFAGSDVHNKTHIRCFESVLKIKNIEPLKQAIKNNVLFE